MWERQRRRLWLHFHNSFSPAAWWLLYGVMWLLSPCLASLPSAGIPIQAAGSWRCPAGSHALVCFGWVGFQFPGLPA